MHWKSWYLARGLLMVVRSLPGGGQGNGGDGFSALGLCQDWLVVQFQLQGHLWPRTQDTARRPRCAGQDGNSTATAEACGLPHPAGSGEELSPHARREIFLGLCSSLPCEFIEAYSAFSVFKTSYWLVLLSTEQLHLENHFRDWLLPSSPNSN